MKSSKLFLILPFTFSLSAIPSNADALKTLKQRTRGPCTERGSQIVKIKEIKLTALKGAYCPVPNTHKVAGTAVYLVSFSCRLPPQVAKTAVFADFSDYVQENSKGKSYLLTASQSEVCK